MRRGQTFVTLLGVVGLLLVPATPSSSADPPPPFRIEGSFRAIMPPDAEGPEPPPPPHRVVGPAQMTDVEMDVVIDCRLQDGGEEFVIAQLRQAAGHGIAYERDDDLHDGFGELLPTDDTRQFRDVGAIEIRDDGSTAPAEVSARFTVDGDPSGRAGRFHRILRKIEIHATMDIRVVRNPGTAAEEEVCHTERHRIRVLAQLFPLGGPYLVEGEIRDEEPWFVRQYCDSIQDVPRPSHICPPEEV